MNFKKRLVSLASLIVVFSLLCPSLLLAAGNIGITVADPDPYSTNKSWFYFTYDEGKVLTSSVMVKNFGKSPTIVNVYPVDATVNEAGSFVLRFQNEVQKGLGEWLKIKTNTVKLGPGESKEIPFTLELPAGVEPGEYFGGVVVQESNDNKISDTGLTNTIGASVNTRVGSRVYLTVPGDVREDFQWKSFEHTTDELGDKQYFKFAIGNDGNVSFSPSVNLKFYNWFGREIASSTHDLGVSLPGSVIEPLVVWQNKPFFGRYTVKAELLYKRSAEKSNLNVRDKILNKQVVIWVVPWRELIILLTLIVVVVAYFKYRSRRFSLLLKNADKYVVKDGDNIQDLAAEAGISWKLLAKLNGLQPPYVLEKGEIIMIPKNKN